MVIFGVTLKFYLNIIFHVLSLNYIIVYLYLRIQVCLKSIKMVSFWQFKQLEIPKTNY